MGQLLQEHHSGLFCCLLAFSNEAKRLSLVKEHLNGPLLTCINNTGFQIAHPFQHREKDSENAERFETISQPCRHRAFRSP